MAAEKIAAEKRTEFGKGAARRIRRADKIPAVIYGHGSDPIHVTLPGHETMLALKHGGSNALLDLDIDGDSQLALTKQVQVDPIRRILEHIDFVAVKRGEKVIVDVPVHVTGEAGALSEVVFFPGTDRETRRGKHKANLQPGDTVRLHTGGGAGWGDPLTRDPRAVLEDVLDGYVSRETAAARYGVVLRITADGLAVDEAQTALARRVGR